MMLDKMQIEKIINLNNQLNEDIGKLQIENDVLLAKNNLLQEENEKLKSELRGKENEIREQLGCKIAIKALEKQIAKTPMQNYYNEGDYVWECVSCEEVVAEGQNYCHNCGQKLLELD